MWNNLNPEIIWNKIYPIIDAMTLSQNTQYTSNVLKFLNSKKKLISSHYEDKRGWVKHLWVVSHLFCSSAANKTPLRKILISQIRENLFNLIKKPLTPLFPPPSGSAGRRCSLWFEYFHYCKFCERCPQASHPTFSPLYDLLDHTHYTPTICWKLMTSFVHCPTNHSTIALPIKPTRPTQTDLLSTM